MYYLKNKTKAKENKMKTVTDTEKQQVFVRREGGDGGEIDEGDWEVQASSYKINKPQVCNIKCNEYGQ